MKACNTTLEDLAIVEDPLWNNGLTFHQLGLIISAAFGLVSVIVALSLIFRHATHYSKPWEQKHIIRILLMIPIYSTVSFLSYLNYRHAIYYEVLRDCYEAFAIASFFTLMCHYIAPTLHEQKEFFRGLKPVNWFWGVFGLQKCTGGKNKGLLRIPRSGLTWFNVVWVSIFQYCLIRVLFTILSVVTQYFDRYCEASLSPEFAHVWVMAFEAASVTIAMFCLIQFYIQLKTDLAPHRPFLKVLCIKLVIFFSFWQSLVISFLSSDRGPLRPTATLAYPDIKIGIPSALLCIEMALFSILHIFAFSWKPYLISSLSDPTNPSTKTAVEPSGYAGSHLPPAVDDDGVDRHSPALRYHGGFLGIKALLDAFNPWDIIKASARGFRWLFVGRRNRFQDTSYSSNMPSTGAIATEIAQGLSPMKPSKSSGPATTFEAMQHNNEAEYHAPPHTLEQDTAYKGASTEMPPSRGRTTYESDRAGLLSHAAYDADRSRSAHTAGPRPDTSASHTDSSPQMPAERFQDIDLRAYHGSQEAEYTPQSGSGGYIQQGYQRGYPSNAQSGSSAEGYGQGGMSMPDPGSYGGHSNGGQYGYHAAQDDQQQQHWRR